MTSRLVKPYLLLLALLAFPLNAAFVTDKLLAGVYDKPDTSSPPTKVLPSGTPIEILEAQGDFTKVRLSDSAEGWMESQFLTTEKPARVMLLQQQAKNNQLQKKLNAAQRTPQEQSPGTDNTAELEELKLQLADAQKQISALSSTADSRKSDISANEALQGQLGQLESELKSTKKSLSDALDVSNKPIDDALATENSELKERMKNAAALLGITPVATPADTQQYQNSGFELWHFALLTLALLVSFVGGVAYKNHRLAKRYGGFRI